ncbi:hypothetical protein WA026_022060 [Henosepilachna vigintioctopunctata]|uniref:Uncharacterized protein n=1 Tax=Henosepilachna vigintioctopunctata TaxID=420089 RepID=A0AAW1U600_9CUCU
MIKGTGLSEHQIRYRRESDVYKKCLERERNELKAFAKAHFIKTTSTKVPLPCEPEVLQPAPPLVPGMSDTHALSVDATACPTVEALPCQTPHNIPEEITSYAPKRKRFAGEYQPTSGETPFKCSCQWSRPPKPHVTNQVALKTDAQLEEENQGTEPMTLRQHFFIVVHPPILEDDNGTITTQWKELHKYPEARLSISLQSMNSEQLVKKAFLIPNCFLNFFTASRQSISEDDNLTRKIINFSICGSHQELQQTLDLWSENLSGSIPPKRVRSNWSHKTRGRHYGAASGGHDQRAVDHKKVQHLYARDRTKLADLIIERNNLYEPPTIPAMQDVEKLYIDLLESEPPPDNEPVSLTDVPPQSNSPPGSVLGSDHAGALNGGRGRETRPRPSRSR